MTVTDELLEAFEEFTASAYDVLAELETAKLPPGIPGYPSYLPSFDEFVLDLAECVSMLRTAVEEGE